MNRAGHAPQDASDSVVAAHWPRDDRAAQRLLVVDAERGTVDDSTLGRLGDLLHPGDLLVFNDAATLPASFRMSTERNDPVELRLLRESQGVYWALALGHGDWRQRTEERGPPPGLSVGDVLTATARAGSQRDDEPAPPELRAHVVDLPFGKDATGVARIVALRFELTEAALWHALYAFGRPIQYSYLELPLELWHVQNVFAARPWAFELPSAARGFDWQLLLSLKRRGIEFSQVTHAAGISSTGSPDLDRQLPLPERYEVKSTAVAAIQRARHRRSRVVAVGTSVVRALESAAATGDLRAGEGEATLVLGPRLEHDVDSAATPRLHRPRVVDSVLSGIHQPGESHFDLVQTFAPPGLVRHASQVAQARRYLGHEFGDACLVLGVSDIVATTCSVGS